MVDWFVEKTKEEKVYYISNHILIFNGIQTSRNEIQYWGAVWGMQVHSLHTETRISKLVSGFTLNETQK